MCEYCNGDVKKQEPILSDYDCSYDPVITVIRKTGKLSIITEYDETQYPVSYCPMCGHKLK